MFAKSTSRRLARATRTTIAIEADTDTGITFRPARRPARRNVEQAAIRASLMGLAF
ncbi:hypothetical protein [Micromonospora sp. NBC_00421]|uniref:hypothetical protein n=1 Tax=Micromonospora sp. NBC_00421 TaxID=2975976 RepID=UPI002E24B900